MTLPPLPGPATAAILFAAVAGVALTLLVITIFLRGRNNPGGEE